MISPQVSGLRIVSVEPTEASLVLVGVIVVVRLGFGAWGWALGDAKCWALTLAAGMRAEPGSLVGKDREDASEAAGFSPPRSV